MRPRTRNRWRMALLRVWVVGTLVGAAWALLGTDDLDLVVIVALSILVTELVTSRLVPRGQREQERAVRAALREHIDPGPDLRPSVDEAARRELATLRRDRWTAGLLTVGLGVACLVTAWVRGDAVAILPAVSLAALAVLADAGARRQRRAARQWLDDPPVPASAGD